MILSYSLQLQRCRRILKRKLSKRKPFHINFSMFFMLFTLLLSASCAPFLFENDAYTYRVFGLWTSLALTDHLRTRNMTFIHPSSSLNDSYIVGQSYTVETRNYGLDSILRLRTSDIYLLYDEYNMAPAFKNPIASSSEHKFLKTINRTVIGMPGWSEGSLKWTVPNVTAGFYRLKYSSGWNVWRDRAKFIQVSPRFEIRAPS